VIGERGPGELGNVLPTSVPGKEIRRAWTYEFLLAGDGVETIVERHVVGRRGCIE
jgi:hypothetical protein